MVALHNQLRTALTELTMGCVYSYPLFSFQGSICFSAAKIILSNLHFLVKHFFIFIFVLFTDISHQQKLVYQVRVHLSMFLFKNFSIFCDFCDSIFSVCSAVFTGTFIYYTRLPKNVNTFFQFFLIFCFFVFFLHFTHFCVTFSFLKRFYI